MPRRGCGSCRRWRWDEHETEYMLGIVQAFDAFLPLSGLAPCADGAAAWAPDVVVLCAACVLLAAAAYSRCTKRAREIEGLIGERTTRSTL